MEKIKKARQLRIIAGAGTAVLGSLVARGIGIRGGIGGAIGAGIAVAKDGDAFDIAAYSFAGNLIARTLNPDSLSGPAWLSGVAEMKTKWGTCKLNHSLDELKRVFPSIANYTLQDAAKYADCITIAQVNNPDFLVEVLQPVNSLRNWNTTSVGNLAYLAMNCKAPIVREYAKGLLAMYKKYKNGK